MRSSTSSSDPYSYEDRPIPANAWGRAAVLALALVLAATGLFEVRVRELGYTPSFLDNGGLWSLQRRRVETEGRDAVVFVGSSRILFDSDLSQYRAATGRPTIQLAVVGTSPRMFLEDLANDANFTGLAVVGITPPLFFTERGGFQDFVLDYYRKESPSERIGQRIGMALERRLAFLDNTNLPLLAMLKHIELPNREGVEDPYWDVWKLEDTEADRQTWMWPRVWQDPAYQARSQQAWVHLIQGMSKGGPPPPADEAIEDVKASIAKIRARGGEVVFVRMPSCCFFREVEAKGFPREQYWDRLLKETDTVGIHFEDYPELQGFDTPEWSHLTKEEAIRFTRNLLPLLDAKLREAGKPGILKANGENP
jgi:hypothetical protein